MKKKRKGLFRWFRKGSAGVTVFEVMIALALFAVIITPVMRSFVTAIKVNKRSRDVMIATDVADAIMEGIKGRFTFTSLRGILPDFMEMAFGEAMVTFGRKIRGFDDPDALMAAVESRTSSPVRILREKDCVSLNIRGVYPCGEGAGYAGGIVSAAVDGIRVAGNLLSNP